MKIGRQYITEDVFEFMKRIVIHIADKGFQQIRYYGFYSNKFKNKIKDNHLLNYQKLKEMRTNTLWLTALYKAFGYDPTLCKCGYQMELNYELSEFKRKGNYG